MVTYQTINNLFNDNRNAKSQVDRMNVINNHQDLLISLQYMADQKALHSEPGDYNPYYIMINELTTWIISGKTKHDKNYKSKLKNENPSDIKDNLKTNNRTYKGSVKNYYTDGSLVPTKNELNNKYIYELVQSLHYYQKSHKNRYKVSKAIRQTKDDLNEALLSLRGENHEGRTDNEPDVEPEPVVEPLDLDNIINNDPIIKDYFNGYTEIETGKRNGLSKSSVSRKLHKVSTAWTGE